MSALRDSRPPFDPIHLEVARRRRNALMDERCPAWCSSALPHRHVEFEEPVNVAKIAGLTVFAFVMVVAVPLTLLVIGETVR